jgi:hypothetical protein
VTLEEREALAQAMIPHAAELVRLVGRGDADGIASLLDELVPVRPVSVDALVIVLAAMSGDDDEPTGEPEPETHSAAVLRAAHAKAKACREARIRIPETVAVLEAEYHRWRHQVRQWRAAGSEEKPDVAA